MGSLNSVPRLNFDINDTPLGWMMTLRPADADTGNHHHDKSGINGHTSSGMSTPMKRRALRSISTSSENPSGNPSSPNGSAQEPNHPPAYDYAHEGRWTALQYRCQTHPSECGYVDQNRNTPLHLACRRQPPRAIVESLLNAHKESVRVATMDGMTPLHFACYCGASHGVIGTLVSTNPQAAGWIDRRGRTPLHLLTAGFRTANRCQIIDTLLSLQYGAGACISGTNTSASDTDADDTDNDAASAPGGPQVHYEDVLGVTSMDYRGRTPLMLLFEDYAEEIDFGGVLEHPTESLLMNYLVENQTHLRGSNHHNSRQDQEVGLGERPNSGRVRRRNSLTGINQAQPVPPSSTEQSSSKNNQDTVMEGVDTADQPARKRLNSTDPEEATEAFLDDLDNHQQQHQASHDMRDCWESITLLLKASYYHMLRDYLEHLVEAGGVGSSSVSSTLRGESGEERDFSSFPVLSLTLSESSAELHQLSHDEEKDEVDANPKNDNDCDNDGSENNDNQERNTLQSSPPASQPKDLWNIVHAVVGVPHVPYDFVRIVLDLHRNLVAMKDAYGNLPLHIAAAAPVSLERHLCEREVRRNRIVKRDIGDDEGWQEGVAGTSNSEGGEKSSSGTFLRRTGSYENTTSLVTNHNNNEQNSDGNRSSNDKGDTQAKIIRELLAIYPEGTDKRDAVGRLPLHVALEHGKSWGKGGVMELVDATFPPGNSDLSGAAGDAAGQLFSLEDEEQLQQSIMKALSSSLNGDPSLDSVVHADNNEESHEITTSKSTWASNDGGVMCSPIQVETSKTLAHLLPRWRDKMSLAEALLSRALEDDNNSDSHSETASYIAKRASMLYALGTVLKSDMIEDVTGGSARILASSLEVSKTMLFHDETCIRVAAAKILGAVCHKSGPDATRDILRKVVLGNHGDGTPFEGEGADKENNNDTRDKQNQKGNKRSKIKKAKGEVQRKECGLNSSSDENAVDNRNEQDLSDTNFDSHSYDQCSTTEGHGKACALYHIFSTSVGYQLDETVFMEVVHFLKSNLMRYSYETIVREAACLACGPVLASAKLNPALCRKELKSPILRAMRPTGEEPLVHKAMARGLCIAAKAHPALFRGKQAVPILDGALMLALSAGCTSVRTAYNDFLWLALRVGENEDGLHEYMKHSKGENGKIMMALVTKVLGQMDATTTAALEDDESM